MQTQEQSITNNALWRIRRKNGLEPKQVAWLLGQKSPDIISGYERGAKNPNLTNGGDDALRVFFDTFVEPRSSILICEPTFPMYRYYAEIAGAWISVLRYGSEMEFPLGGVIAALRKKPRVLFIANPNNPTGTLLKTQSCE